MAKMNINGVIIEGENITILNGRVIVDKADISGRLDLTGGILEVRVIEGSVGSIRADGSVTAGEVRGDVTAGGSVKAGDIGGRVNAGGSVSCGKVAGNVNAGGSVRMG